MTPLRQRLLGDLQIRNYAPRTIACYVAHVAHFARHFGQPPDQLGAEDVRAWHLHLLQVRHAFWSAFNQAVCAWRFF
jgi:integrase/recombinase XerD